MKKFGNFSKNAISSSEMKQIKGGIMLYCTCANGDHFQYSTIGSSRDRLMSFAAAVCGSGNVDCAT